MGHRLLLFHMIMQWSLLGDIAENVISFLDARHLGRMECAGKEFDSEITKLCWGKLATMERSIVERRPYLRPIPLEATTYWTCTPLEASTSKEVLKTLFRRRLHLSTPPESWSPWIKALSHSSLVVSPCDVNAAATSAEGDRSAPHVPPYPTVPVLLGTTFGQEMLIGLHIQSETTRANEGVWLALELGGVLVDWGFVISVRCAPLTGRCKIVYPGQSKIMVAQVMPPLPDHLCDSVEIYVTVSKTGDVEFVRLSGASKSITRSGRMSHDMLFPGWASEIFADVSIQMNDVLSETTVSTKLLAGGLQQFQEEPEFDFEWCGWTGLLLE